jgi:hypothetical protein
MDNQNKLIVMKFHHSEKKYCQLQRWELGRDYNCAKSAAVQFQKFENPYHISPIALETTDAT